MSSSRSEYKAKCLAILLNVDVCEQVSTGKFEPYLHWKERRGRVQLQGVWMFKILSCQTGDKTLIIDRQVDCKVGYLYSIFRMYNIKCRYSVIFEKSWGPRRAAIEGMMLGETVCRRLFSCFKFESKRARQCEKPCVFLGEKAYQQKKSNFWGQGLGYLEKEKEQEFGRGCSAVTGAIGWNLIQDILDYKMALLGCTGIVSIQFKCFIVLQFV